MFQIWPQSASLFSRWHLSNSIQQKLQFTALNTANPTKSFNAICSLIKMCVCLKRGAGTCMLTVWMLPLPLPQTAVDDKQVCVCVLNIKERGSMPWAQRLDVMWGIMMLTGRDEPQIYTHMEACTQCAVFECSTEQPAYIHINCDHHKDINNPLGINSLNLTHAPQTKNKHED